MQTGTKGTPANPLSLAQLNELVTGPQPRIPFGFFVGKDLMVELERRCQKDAPSLLAGAVHGSLRGAQIVVDPEMDSRSCDVAFTEDAWRERLAKLKK